MVAACTCPKGGHPHHGADALSPVLLGCAACICSYKESAAGDGCHTARPSSHCPDVLGLKGPEHLLMLVDNYLPGPLASAKSAVRVWSGLLHFLRFAF